jgi:pilus assembly protein Flp/PilA
MPFIMHYFARYRFVSVLERSVAKSSVGRTCWIANLTEAFMNNLVSRFLKDESGATAIEYGLIAAGIAVVIIAAVQLVGSNLNGTFGSVATAVQSP